MNDATEPIICSSFMCRLLPALYYKHLIFIEYLINLYSGAFLTSRRVIIFIHEYFIVIPYHLYPHYKTLSATVKYKTDKNINFQQNAEITACIVDL